MPVRVVRQHGHHHLFARVVALLRTVLGGTLLGVGVLTLPWGLLFGLALAEDARLKRTGGAAVDEPAIFTVFPWPRSTLVLAIVGTTVLLVLAVVVGLRLVRGDRRLVLFLRRFRDAEAIGALSSAAAGSVGQAWRVVTLDDGDIAPMGVAAGTRRFFGLLRAGGRVVRAVFELPQVGACLLGAAAGVLGLRYLQTGQWELERVASVLADEQAMFGVFPAPPTLGWDLETLLYVLVVGGVLLIFVGVLPLLVLPVLVVLAGPAILVQQASDAARAAEDRSRPEISGAAEIGAVTAAVVSVSRKVFAPRLVVVRVDHGCWRQCVRRFAEVAAATVVDVSEPSEHVLWEIEQVRARPGSRLVLVGHLPELGPLLDEASPTEANDAGDEDGSGTDPPWASRRLAALIDGEEVLAYTLTFSGRRRFARALRSTLRCRRQGGRTPGDVAAGTGVFHPRRVPPDGRPGPPVRGAP
jgi:hypothetical protein